MIKLTVLGSGHDAAMLSEAALKAANQLGMEFQLSKTDNQDDIIEHGVIVTPALLINGTTAFSGTMPTVDEIAKALKKASA